MGPTVAPRNFSGLQKEVLALYRSILREAIRKDRRNAASSSMQQQKPTGNNNNAPESYKEQTSSQPRWLPFRSYVVQSSSVEDDNSALRMPETTLSYARTKFRQEASQVKRSDFKTIEYKIRKGRKQLQLLKMPGVDLVGGI